MTRALTVLTTVLALLLAACGSPAMTADRIREIGEATVAGGTARFAVDIDLGPLAALGLQAPGVSGVIDPASDAVLLDVDMPEDLAAQLERLASMFGQRQGDASDAEVPDLQVLSEDFSALLIEGSAYARGGIFGEGWVGPFVSDSDHQDDADHRDDGDHLDLAEHPELADLDVETLMQDLRDALAEPLTAIAEDAQITAVEVDGQSARSYSVTVDAEDVRAIGDAIAGVVENLDLGQLPDADELAPTEMPQLPGPLGQLDLSAATATLTAVVADDTDRLRELRGDLAIDSLQVGAALRLFDFGEPEALVAPADAQAPDEDFWALLEQRFQGD